MEAREKLARDGHPVAAVISLAAQHRDALFGERRAMLRQKFHHAVRGIFHQHDAGNAHLDGAPVHLAHFGGGQDFHIAPRHHHGHVILQFRRAGPLLHRLHGARDDFRGIGARVLHSSSSFNRSSPYISP